MKLIKYQAHNVKGVKNIQFDLAGRHLFLVGGSNGQGKTSALDALVMALCGKRGMDDYPPVALRRGQKKGKVTVELTGDEDVPDSDVLTVELSLRRKASGEVVEEFRVLDSSGEEAPEPRTLLKKLFQLKAFDPLAFERMKPKEQASVVQGMLGVDLAKYDKQRAEAYEKRRQLGIEGKRLAAQLEATPRSTGVPDDEVSVSDLMAELETVHAQVEMRRMLEQTVSRYQSTVAELDSEIEELQAKLVEAEAARKRTLESLAKAETSLASEEYADRTERLKEVKESIASADDINRKVRQNAEHKRLASEVKRSRSAYQRLTDEIAAIDEEKAEAIAAAPWPVPGMELLEDGLLLNGLPFEQASTSQRIMASVKVGMALNPKLRLLVCEHGSDLDGETLDSLDKICKEEDFQMIVEIVTRTQEDEDRCAVVIANGGVVGDTTSSEEDEMDAEDGDEE